MNQSNELLKQNIEKKLDWDARLEDLDIKIDAREGIVQLKGKIPSLRMKRIISQDVREMSGVQNVKNDLTVEYEELTQENRNLTDNDIENNIKIALELNPSINAKKIDVKVFHKIATLGGTVDSYWKKEIAEYVASEVRGVVNIVNQVSIAPTENILDEKIAEKITSTLENFYNVNLDKIDIIVKNGTITVKGAVKDWSAYDIVMKAIKYTIGVKDVKDELKIQNNKI